MGERSIRGVNGAKAALSVQRTRAATTSVAEPELLRLPVFRRRHTGTHRLHRCGTPRPRAFERAWRHRALQHPLERSGAWPGRRCAERRRSSASAVARSKQRARTTTDSSARLHRPRHIERTSGDGGRCDGVSRARTRPCSPCDMLPSPLPVLGRRQAAAGPGDPGWTDVRRTSTLQSPQLSD